MFSLMGLLLGAQLCFSMPAQAAPLMTPFPQEARSGCCSHHGGVCGCSFGSARCCDGGLSPSCGC